MEIKKLLIVLGIQLLSYFTFSQTTDVLTELDGPCGLVFHQDELFVSELGNIADDENRVFKFDVTDTANPVITNLVTGLDDPNILLMVNNDLYIAEFNGNRIIKIDATVDNPTPVTVIYPVLRPRGLAYKDNFLYVALFDSNKVVKLDLSTSDPTPIDVAISVTKPSGLVFYNNDLYIAERFANKISKIDISAQLQEATTLLEVADPMSMEFRGNELFFSQPTLNKISKINILDQNPIAVEVVGGLGFPSEIKIKGDELYISEQTNNKISKFNLESLSVSSSQINDNILYPNPANEFIAVDGSFQIENYEIYDFSGRLLLSSRTIAQNTIDVSSLQPGNYFLIFNNGIIKKFIKS